MLVSGKYCFDSTGFINLSHLLLPPLLCAALAGVTAVLSMLPSTDHVADAYEGVSTAAGTSRSWMGSRQQLALGPEPTATSMHQLHWLLMLLGCAAAGVMFVSSCGSDNLLY
jgi:hypothetical protein